MTKVDLITGFLGSGKTTFLKQYALWLLDQGLKVGIIENDFGAVNVDMLLLQDLEEKGAVTEMVAAADLDCYRRRFKTKLIALGMQGLDRVLVEPSGIYDPEEFFDVLYEEPLSRWYEIGSVIAIADAKLEEGLSEDADYLLVSQLADAGRVLLSRTQEASGEQIARTIEHVNRAMERFGCGRRFGKDVIAKDWKDLTDDDYRDLTLCGFRMEDHSKLEAVREGGFGSLYYMNLDLTPQKLHKIAQELLSDPQCGRIFRIKGFVPQGEGWQEINATRGGIRTQQISRGQNVVILVGEDMKKDRIDIYFRGERQQ
ncbi:MAG: GTPase (G3E family) [Lachnospiraceae bacterium]|nr:GTPase (G3E family) [Lachnospiraceae bacterium]